MKNKKIENFIENEFNQNKNYEQILSKIRKEQIMKKRILSVFAILFITIIVGISSNQIYARYKWNIEFKEYQNNIKTGRGRVNNAYEEGLDSNIEIDSIYQDGIEIKPISLLLTDDYLGLDFEFKFNKDLEVNSETFNYGICIYDENNNIYYYTDRTVGGMNDEYWRFIAKTLGMKGRKKFWNAVFEYADSAGQGIVYSSDNIIKTHTEVDSHKAFPKCKKMYIKVFNIGYYMCDWEACREEQKFIGEDFKLSDKEWSFEIDVPEKFNSRNTKQVVLKEEVEGVELKSGAVSDTSLNIFVKLKGITQFISDGRFMEGNEFSTELKERLSITDDEGNVYCDLSFGTAGEDDVVRGRYDLSIKDFERKLYLNVKIDGVKHKIELECK